MEGKPRFTRGQGAVLFQCQDEPEVLGTWGRPGEAMGRDLEAARGKGAKTHLPPSGSMCPNLTLSPFCSLCPNHSHLPQHLPHSGTLSVLLHILRTCLSALTPPLCPSSHQSLGSIYSTNTVANPLSSLLSLPGVQTQVKLSTGLPASCPPIPAA